MDEGIKTLVKNLIKLSILYVGASLFSFAQSKIMVTLAYKTTNLIRKDLFDHMQTLPLRFFDSKTHGEIMSRFTNDVDNVQMMLEQSMVQLVSSAFTFVGIVAMMIVLSPTLFAFALIFLIIMLITVSQIGKKSRKYFRLQQKNLGVMNGNIEESVEGMKVIPLDTEVLKRIVSECVKYKTLYTLFDSAYESTLPPHLWYENCLKARI